MRLSKISDQVLDDYDLDRFNARREARAGQLWATPDGRAVAVAPTEAGARWMLGEDVEPVVCSSMSSATIVKVHFARARSAPCGRAFEWDPTPGSIGTGQTGSVGAGIGWRQASAADGVAPAAELLEVDNHIGALTPPTAPPRHLPRWRSRTPRT